MRKNRKMNNLGQIALDARKGSATVMTPHLATLVATFQKSPISLAISWFLPTRNRALNRRIVRKAAKNGFQLIFDLK